MRPGTIAAGRDADLVAVPGNPLRDLSTVPDVRAVIRAGRAARERTAGASLLLRPALRSQDPRRPPRQPD
ncbi:hypothetical protein ACIGW1_36415 [Streptomyces sp. NPDC053780]|uniref:hypothetical protein n=1 Tax=unclassified Streptomyces TaxID=2593676 RepID=UPI0034252A65